MAGLAGGWRFGLLPLAALWIGVNTFGASRIEADIAERTRQALDRLGLRGVETKIDGRDVTLGGELDDSARAQARDAIAGIDGVGNVAAGMAPSPAIPAPDATRPDGRAPAPEATRAEPLAAASTTANPSGDASTAKPAATPQAGGQISAEPKAGAPQQGATPNASESAASSTDATPSTAKTDASQDMNAATGQDAPKPAPAETAQAPATTPTAPDVSKTASAASQDENNAAPPAPATSAAACQARMAELVTSQPIQFTSGSARISVASADILDALAEQANACPGVNFEVAGHTDDVGITSENLELSRRRAENVLVYLVSAGVDPQRLRAVGYGESRPLVTNDSDENRAKNRRIEFNLK